MENKLPKKDKGLGFLRHWKVMTMTLLLLTFSIGQMWGADRYIFGKTAVSSTGTLTTSNGKNIMVRTSNAGTSYSNVNEFFTYDENVPSSGSSVYMAGNEATTSSSSAQLQALKWKKNKTTTISWTNTKLKINNIKIYPYEGSSKNIKLTISNGTTSKEFTIQKKAGSSQTLLSVIEISDVVYTSSTGISVTVDNTEDLNALIFFEADDYVEITNGDTEAFQGESIPMYANTTGVEWGVTSGASITSAGLLTIGGSTTGTVTVTCSKGGKSDTREITVITGTTKDVTWNFGTLKGGPVYATGVQSAIAASDASYEGGYVNLINNWVGVDVSSTDYKITAASFNVKTPSGTSKKVDYDYLASGSKSAAGNYSTLTSNYETGSVASIDDKTAFRLWKNSTTTQVKSITLTLKRTLSCSTPAAPTAFAKTAVTATTATFSITDAGDAASYDLYYASGTPSTPTESTTATANVNTKTPTIEGLTGGTTYKIWVRSVCDADHKSSWVALGDGGAFTTLTEPTATFSNSTYDIDGGLALNLASLWTSNSEGAVTYSVEDAGGTGATVSTASFTATTAGTAKVKAVQAAAGAYSEVTKYAYITVGSNAVGEHTITYNVATGTSQTTLATASKVSTSLRINNLSDIALYGEGMSVQSGGGKTNSTPKIPTPSSEDANKYTYLTFAVQEGYEFTISQISTKLVAVSTDKTVKLEISDNNGGTTQSLSYTHTTDSDPGTGHDFEFTTNNTYSGTVTIKLFVWGDDKTYRLGKPLTITGTIAEVDVTAPTFVSSVPANSATGVDVSGTIVLTFSEDIASVDDSKFSLSNATIGTVAIDGTDATKVNVPYTDAVNEATVTLSVDAEAVADAAGNKSAALSDIAFTIAASGVCVKPDAPEDLGVEVKTNNYAKFIWDNGTAGANGYEISLTSEAVGAAGKFDWKDEDDAIYEATGLTPETEYTFKVKYKGTVDDCYSDEVTTTFTTYAACTELVPETSGDSPSAIGEEIRLQGGSTGGKIYVADNKAGKTLAESFTYTANGISLNTGGKDSLRVELSSLMKVGTVISAEIYNANDDKARGLLLQNMSKTTKATWTTTMVGTHYETYTVVAGDGLAGSNKFLLARSETAALKSLTVSNCGDAVYEVTFDMKNHGSQVAKQVLTAGEKVTEPTEPEAAGYIFGGWYKETTLENAWNFSTDVVPSNNITLYAKWTEDPCTDRQSLSKVVLTSASEGTVTGYNGNEYAGTAIIAALSGTKSADLGDGSVTGYKLSSGGNSIVMATLKKGNFQEGDKVTVGIVYQNDQRTVDASTNIMTIYAGSDKDHMMEVTTLTGVTGAGYYTYRLTAADATAINTAGYKSIGLFRASSNGENHYVYSVEITGCRSWTTTHTVTYNKMGKGADIAPAVVAVGDLVPKPSVVEPDGWALVGWFKEEGLVNEWNFASDVMPDNNLTLYAKWEDETGVIKLFDGEGNLNTTNFVSAAKKDGGIDIDEVNYPCLVDFGSNRTSLNGTTQADVVQYNATTNTAKIKLDLYNNATGAKTAYLWMVEEGATESGDPIAINVPGKTRLITSYTSFNSEKPRSFYVTSGSKSDIKVLQVKVLDNGTDIPQFGKAGYVVNLNKGRIIAAANGTVPFDGATMHSNDAYTVLNSSNFKPKTYIQFNNAVANTTVKITKASSNKYYVTNDLDNKGDEYSTDQEIVLTTTGTWYIGSVNSGSVAALSKIEFVAPKCEAPAFNALANSGICEGDPYVALDGTGTVSDGGSITYKWYAQGSETVLATTATYTPAADGNYYVVALHHVDGYTDNEVTSDVVTVTTYASAAITTAPEDKRLDVGQVATLEVVASGKAPLTYHWYTCDDAEGTNPVIIDGAESDSYAVTVTAGMNQYYKVVVGSGCGSASAVAKVEEWVELPQLTVSNTTEWDWVNAGENMSLTDNTTPKINEEFLMANIKVGSKQPTNDETFNSQALLFYGEHVRKVESSRAYASIGHIKFTVTRPGKVTVVWSDNGTNNRRLKINDAIDESSTSKTDIRTFSAIVTPGVVTLEGVNSDGTGNNKYLRISKITYDITDVVGADYTRDVTEGRYGTICLPKEGVMVGASIFELAYYSAGENKIFMDQVVSGEMVAGRPYVFLPYEGADKLGVFYTDDEAVAAGNYRGLYGYFDGTDNSMQLEPGDGHYILHNNLFREVTGSYVWIDQNRAYFKIGVEGGIPTNAVAPLPGRRRMSIGAAAPQAPTGLENGELINGENGVQKVLINGELFILRGEKMYDATGRLVK